MEEETGYSFQDFLGDLKGTVDTGLDIYGQRLQIEQQTRASTQQQPVAQPTQQPATSPQISQIGTWQLAALGVSLVALVIAGVLVATRK